MSETLLIGHLTPLDPEAWADYRQRVPATLAPWGAEWVLRGALHDVLAGEPRHSHCVVIRFPDLDAARAWYASEAYQALLPLRERAARMDLMLFSGEPTPEVRA